MWGVRVTIVAVEKLHRMLWCCSPACHFQPYKNTECGKTMLLWQIYVAGNKKTCEGLHAKCPMLQWNTRMTVCWWLSLDQCFPDFTACGPFWFRKISMDPHVLVHASILL